MATNWPPKDPDEELDYALDWTTRDLGDDVIVSSTYDLVDGDVVIFGHGVADVEDVPAGQATVTWLKLGTVGVRSEILIKATTATGRKLEETVFIRIKER